MGLQIDDPVVVFFGRECSRRGALGRSMDDELVR
jgi:hypothetical protein